MSGINRETMAHISRLANRFQYDLIRASGYLQIGVGGDDEPLTPEYMADLARVQAELYRFLAAHPVARVGNGVAR